MTVDSYRLAAALLRKARVRGARFKGARAYLSAIKIRHVQKGHAWTDQLAQEAKECGRAVARDLGPAKQARQLPAT